MSDTPQFQERAERFGLLRLEVEVGEDGLGVRLRPFERTVTWLPLGDIAEVDVATYSASDYGGWHWGKRTAPGGITVYRLRGSQGVEVTKVDGRKIFIGSQRPKELRDAMLRGR